jgi:hypothetical protein
LDILILDSTNYLASLHPDVDYEVNHDVTILEDVLGLTELIEKFQRVVLVVDVFPKENSTSLQKILGQVVNVIDTCLFLDKSLYLVSPFTPYYGNTQVKAIYESSINESSDLDDLSLSLHQIAQEVERGRQEGCLITFLRTGFDFVKYSHLPLLLSNIYQWRTFPRVSTTENVALITSILQQDQNPNSNIILVDSFLSESDFPDIINQKNSFLNKLKSLIRKEKYSNTLPIQLDMLLPSSS